MSKTDYSEPLAKVAFSPQEELGSPWRSDGAASGGVQEACLPASVASSAHVVDISPAEVLFGHSGVDSYMFLHTWPGGMCEAIKSADHRLR